MNQILAAIAHCHANGIVHRDLKPENVVLNFKENYVEAKLIDFGHAGYFTPGKYKTKRLGTLHYMAPEVLKNLYT